MSLGWMRPRRTQRDEIAGVGVGLRAVVPEIDLHLRDEVVFLLRGRREEESLSDVHAFRRLALELDAPVSLPRRW